VRLLDDPDLRGRMSVASRKRHRRLFTVDRMLDETVAVFDRVADGGPPRPPTAGFATPCRGAAGDLSSPAEAMKGGGGP
jgi:hypothetical protein